MKNNANTAYKELVANKTYLINLAFLFYPFVLMAAFALTTASNNKFLVRLALSAVFNLTFFALALTSIFLFRNIFAIKIVLRFAHLFQFGYLLITIQHYFMYKQLLGIDSLYSLIDTDFHEAVEFSVTTIKPEQLVWSLALALPLLYLGMTAAAPNFSITRRNKRLCLASLAAFGAVTFLPISTHKFYLIDYNPFIYASRSTAIIMEEKREINKLYLSMSKTNLQVSSDKNPATHILIIGESANRSHMSLYGYHRKTTPNLDQMSNELVVAKNACSSRNYTIASLKDMLTFSTRENPGYLFNAPNILQLMNAAGFDTYWISNQQEISVGESFISILSRSAKHKIFVNHRGWTEGVSLDEKVLDPLKSALSDKANKKFIVIHLLGSHEAYDLRYPPAFGIFNSSEVAEKFTKSYRAYKFNPSKYNDYDNSILYSDHVASRIIKTLDNNTPTTLTYISDHGEAVGEKDGFFGHGLDLPFRSTYEIPLFFWFSEEIKQRINTKIKALQNNVDASFQSDQTIHTLLDLYQVDYPLVNLMSSLANSGFSPKQRYCDRFSEP